jgi:hypothetical protein
MGVPMQLDQDAYEGALAAVSGTTLDPYPDALFVDPSLPVVGGQLPRVPRVPPLHGDTLPVLPPLHGATLPTIPGIDNALPTPPDPPPEMADDQSRREKSSDKPLPKGAR